MSQLAAAFFRPAAATGLDTVDVPPAEVGAKKAKESFQKVYDNMYPVNRLRNLAWTQVCTIAPVRLRASVLCALVRAVRPRSLCRSGADWRNSRLQRGRQVATCLERWSSGKVLRYKSYYPWAQAHAACNGTSHES